MGTNKGIIDSGFAKIKEQIYSATEKRLGRWCEQLVSIAIRMRLGDPEAHNFTGNLLNSIVVCLYKDGSPLNVFYAAGRDGVQKAIMPKMTAREKVYYFKRDYDGGESKFKATIPTNQGWGVDDAKEFFATFKPDGKNMFDVVVAYTTEYAEFVQMQRNTTGILETMGFAKHSGTTFMELISAA